MLAHGGDANSNGVPLYVAASNNNLALIQVLVEHNADVNAEVTGLQSTNGTPLHGACYTGWYNAAISLAVLGANRGEADQNGETPLHKTRRMAKVRLQTQHAALSEWLERTERWSPLRIAASHQRCEEAALALRLGLVLPPTAWGDVKAVLDSAAAGKSETERAAEASAGGGTFGTDWVDGPAPAPAPAPASAIVDQATNKRTVAFMRAVLLSGWGPSRHHRLFTCAHKNVVRTVLLVSERLRQSYSSSGGNSVNADEGTAIADAGVGGGGGGGGSGNSGSGGSGVVATGVGEGAAPPQYLLLLLPTLPPEMWLAILGFVERSWMPGAVKKAWKQPHNATPTTYSFDFN